MCIALFATDLGISLSRATGPRLSANPDKYATII